MPTGKKNQFDYGHWRHVSSGAVVKLVLEP